MRHLIQSTALAISIVAMPLPAAATNVRPLSDRVFPRSEVAKQRGQYLVEGLLQCMICHSDRDKSQPGAPPIATLKGAGHIWWEKDGERLVAPNITPDRETGAGAWTDDMLARAIREGIGHDGRVLHPQMWYASFRELSDDDLGAVINYVRSLPAVNRKLPATHLKPEHIAQFADMPRPVTTVPAPKLDTPRSRGSYLIALADCAGCHSAWEAPRLPGIFAGGNRIEDAGTISFSANLTPDATGLSYGADAFVQVMRTGKWSTLSPNMPWVVFRNLSDADLKDMHAALAAAPPVSHAVATIGEPTYCAVCGQKHPLGDRNHLLLPKGIELPAATLDEFVGHYHNADLDQTIEIFRDGAVLKLRDGPKVIELIPKSPLYFLAPGWVAPIRFVRSDGKVSQLIESDVADYAFVRTPASEKRD